MGLSMDTKNLDIVYCIKEDDQSEELRYSLRSLENIPHRKVWLIGGCPDFVNENTVNCVPMIQSGRTKWEKSNSSVKRACELEDLTENFILFNDDFFVVKPIKRLNLYYHLNLDKRIGEIMQRTHIIGFSEYCRNLAKDAVFLKAHQKPYLNYAVHIPMIFNKTKLSELFEQYPQRVITRAFYGNMCELGGIDTEDVKIYTLDKLPNKDWKFLSTSDYSFRNGLVGEYLRNMFNKPCKYEKEVKNG